DSENPAYQLLKPHLNIVSALVRCGHVSLHKQEPSLGFASSGVVEDLKIMIPLPPEMLKQEKARLEKEQERLQSMLERLKSHLANQDFVANAPAGLVEKQKKALQQAESEMAAVLAKLKELSV